MFGHDGTVVDPLRELLEPLRERAHRLAQRRRIRRAHVDEFFNSARAQLAGGDRTHAPQRIDRKPLQEHFDPFRRDHRQPVGLLPARRNLREELVGRDAGGRGEAGRRADFGFQAARDVHAECFAPRVFRDVQVGLVERQRLHQRRDAAIDIEHLLRHGAVLREVGAHDHQRWAQPDRAGHRDRRTHAERARLVARGGDDAALVGVAADDHRPAAEVGVVALFDGRVERVHVHVKDAPHAQLPVAPNPPRVAWRISLTSSQVTRGAGSTTAWARRSPRVSTTSAAVKLRTCTMTSSFGPE